MLRNAIALVCVIFMAGPVFACGVLEKADPKVGSTVEPTDRITLTFTQAIVPDSSDIKITDATGNQVNAAMPTTRDGNMVLSLKFAHSLTPGIYKIRWNVLWQACGNQTQGTYKFTVK